MRSSAYLFRDGVRPLTAPLVIPLQLRVESLAQASLVVVVGREALVVVVRSVPGVDAIRSVDQPEGCLDVLNRGVEGQIHTPDRRKPSTRHLGYGKYHAHRWAETHPGRTECCPGVSKAVRLRQ